MASNVDHSARSSFKYIPLIGINPIRILKLHPAVGFNETLSIDLIHANRDAILAGTDDIEAYEAVSYCWEGQMASVDIICAQEYRLKITANVERILRHLRKPHKPRFLWIDAVCLNQEDIQEKGKQVQQMGLIYQTASKVHVWLGETHEEERIPALFAGFKAVAMVTGEKTKYVDSLYGTLESISGDSFESRLDRFFSRPWFGRRWILQECALNPDIDVRCGDSKIAWSWFIKAAKHVYRLLSSSLKLSQCSVNSLNMLMEISEAPDSPLLDLVWKFPNSHCQLPHDRIFALYGMASDSSGFGTPTYENHWAEEFTKISVRGFEKVGRTMFFHLLSFGSISEPGWPSWVPDWRTPGRRFISESQEYGSVGPGSEAIFVHSGRILTIHGWYYGDVLSEDHAISDPVGRLDSFMLQDRYWNRDMRIRAMADAFWAAIRCDKYGYARGSPKINTMYYSVRNTLFNIADPESDTPTWEPKSDPIAQLIFDTTDRFSLLSTPGPRGMVGLGPRTAQAGDLVFVPPGLCRWRTDQYVYLGFVVRPNSGGCKLEPSGPRLVPEWNSFRHTNEWEGKPIARGCKFVGPCFVSGQGDDAGYQMKVEII